MTCIVGLRCKDGVVLGADMEIDDGITKHRESKLRKRTIDVQNPYFLAYASNDVGLAKESIDLIKRAISHAEQSGESVTKAARDKYKEVFANDKGQEILSCIWAVKKGPKYRLFHMSNGSVAPDSSAINGTGYYQSINPMKDLYYGNMTLRDGALLTVYLLKMAKLKASGVGFPLQVLMLEDTGGYSMLDYSYVKELEDAYENLHTVFNSLVLPYSDYRDTTLKERLQAFSNSVTAYRSKMPSVHNGKPEKEIGNADEEIEELMP